MVLSLGAAPCCDLSYVFVIASAFAAVIDVFTNAKVEA